MFDLLKEMFIRLSLSIIFKFSKMQDSATLLNLHPNEYNQELHYYPFAVILDVLDVVILLMTYLIKYVFLKSRRFKSKDF